AERESLFWTTLTVNVAFGFAGGAILWSTGRFFLARFFHVPPDMRVEVLAALPWIAAAAPVATGVSVLGGALEGREQFLSLNCLQVIGAAVFQVVPLTVAWLHGPDLRTLIEAAVLARIGASLPMIVVCQKHVPLRAEGR